MGKRGRPQKQDEPSIKKELFEHFNEGHSVLYTSQQTGRNLKTCYAYYSEFVDQMNEYNILDFANRQKAAKEIVLAGLDGDLKIMEDHLKELYDKKDEEKDIAEWDRLYSAVSVNISHLRQQKADLEFTPTIDVSLEQLFLDRQGEDDDKKPIDTKPKKTEE